MKLKEKILRKAASLLNNRLAQLKQEEAPVAAAPTPVPDPVPAPTTQLSEMPDPATLPKIYGHDGKEIPVAMEPLPNYEEFSIMFTRKHGTKGKHPMSLNGEIREFDCRTLYDMLYVIRTSPKANETHWSVYGAVLSVIMHAHGEDVTKQVLN